MPRFSISSGPDAAMAHGWKIARNFIMLKQADTLSPIVSTITNPGRPASVTKGSRTSLPLCAASTDVEAKSICLNSRKICPGVGISVCWMDFASSFSRLTRRRESVRFFFRPPTMVLMPSESARNSGLLRTFTVCVRSPAMILSSARFTS